MNSDYLTVLFAIIFIVFIVMYISAHKEESFYIEPNMIMGGDVENGSSAFELEGPGDDAWSGY
jgi:lipoprotein signal peptidase